MAHIFISYARADRPLVEKLAGVLENAGHSVWWDRHIRGGAAFAKDIESQLQKADAIVVAWSAAANESDWVKDEAVFGRDKGVLIPIRLDASEAPLGFRQYQTLEFDRWRGDADAPAVQTLLSAIADLSGADRPVVATIEPKSLAARAKSDKRFWAAGAVFVIAIFTGVFLLRSGPAPGAVAGGAETAARTTPANRSAPSVAVLPFADMSPEGNQEYFADGLSEELLNVLVRVDGLQVASRTSSFALKDKVFSISEIAERLDVSHVLEGSVRKMNNRVRITAQLIDANTDKHLWSETYDRHLSDRDDKATDPSFGSAWTTWRSAISIARSRRSANVLKWTQPRNSVANTARSHT